MNKQIPIFFSTDDKYAPYLDVALLSMLNNASKKYEYRIIVLNTGISESNAEKLKRHEAPGVSVELIDISRDVDKIRSRLKNVYHFSLVCTLDKSLGSGAENVIAKVDRIEL